MKFTKYLFFVGASILTFAIQQPSITTVNASKPKITKTKSINKLSSKLIDLKTKDINHDEFYTTKNGDTLFSIAKRAKIDVYTLMQLNNIKTASLALNEGQQIRLISEDEYNKEQAASKASEESSSNEKKVQSENTSNQSSSNVNESNVSSVNSSSVSSVNSSSNTSQPQVNTSTEPQVSKVAQQSNPQPQAWSGTKLTQSMGVNTNCPEASRESYYNMNMLNVVAIAKSRGLQGDYSVRDDGVKTFNNYVIVAASYDLYKYGQIVQTSLGQGIVLDTGTFASTNPNQFDLAVNW